MVADARILEKRVAIIVHFARAPQLLKNIDITILIWVSEDDRVAFL